MLTCVFLIYKYS